MLLTPLELDIMKAVWQRSPITVKDVQFAIRPKRHLAYTTVMTTMNRLYLKGFLSRTLRSKAHFYEAAISFAAAREAALDDLVEGFFIGSREVLADFLSDRSITIEPLKRPSGLDESLL